MLVAALYGIYNGCIDISRIVELAQYFELA